MQVAEVRRCLLVVRQAWAHHSPDTPLNLSLVVPNGMPLHSFCYTFILAHHNKRMNRSKAEAPPAGGGGEEEADDEETSRPQVVGPSLYR